MKLHHRTLLALTLAILAGPALATGNHEPPKQCPSGTTGTYPDCKTPEPPKPTTPTQTQTQNTSSEANAGAAAGAVAVGLGGNANAQGGAGGHGGAGGQGGNAQGGAGGTALSGASSTTGDQTTAVNAAGGSSDQSQNAFSGANNTTDVGVSAGASNGDQSLNSQNAASADGSGNADVTIGGDHYEASQTVFQAALPGAPPVFGPGTQATVSYGQCGPYMGISTEDVYGTYIGLIRKQQIYLGRSDRIVEWNGESFRQKRLPDGRWYLEGKRAVRTTTVLNVSGARQVGLGGGDTGGGYGQAAVGGGSSMQRLVTQIDLEPCVAYIEQPTVQPPVIEFKEPRVPRG